jgi:hypothetical protein
MDLGLFRRRRIGFWLWIVCPLLAAASIHFSVFLYCQRMAGMLQEQKAMAALLPDMAGALDNANSIVDEFPAIRATAAEARSALTTRISELSLQHNFLANNVRIKSLTAAGPVQKLEVSIEGEGQMLAIMKFVNDLQTPESLMALVRANIRVNAFFPTPVYNWELGFEAGFAPSMQLTNP